MKKIKIIFATFIVTMVLSTVGIKAAIVNIVGTVPAFGGTYTSPSYTKDFTGGVKVYTESIRDTNNKVVAVNGRITQKVTPTYTTSWYPLSEKVTLHFAESAAQYIGYPQLQVKAKSYNLVKINYRGLWLD